MDKKSLSLSLILHATIGCCLLFFNTASEDKNVHPVKVPIIEFVSEKNPLEKRAVLAEVPAKSLAEVPAKPLVETKDFKISTYDDLEDNLDISATDSIQSLNTKETQLDKNLKTKKIKRTSAFLREVSATRPIEPIKQVAINNKGNINRLIQKTKEPPVHSATKNAVSNATIAALLRPFDLNRRRQSLPSSKQNGNMSLKQSIVPKTALTSSCNVNKTNVRKAKLSLKTINRILGSGHLTITKLIGSQGLQFSNGTQSDISQLLNTQKIYQVKTNNSSFSVTQLLARASRVSNQSEFRCSD